MNPNTFNVSSERKRVLVTGGTGFLGAYILAGLVKQGHSVRAIRRGSNVPAFIPKEVLDKVEWVQGDIMDVSSLDDAMTDIDAVVHSAAVVSFVPRDKQALLSTNIEGTANVVNLALEKGIGRFVHVSSVSALGRAKKDEMVTEDRKWETNKNQTTYGISKFYGELEVWRAIAEGLPAVIVNPSTILGYGDWNTSSCALFRNAYREFPWYSDGVNGFVDVRDVASAIVTLLDSDISGQRYILNGDNWTFRQLLDTMANAFQKRPPHRKATPFLGAIAWRLEKLKAAVSGRKPFLTKESARVAQSRTSFDSSKILQQLPGFRFTPLEETIRTACREYLLNPV